LNKEPRCRAAPIPFHMSDHEQPHPEKKVTAATTDAPQEEFIAQDNIPSQPDPDAKQTQPPKETENE
jgi:hypothetical protein